MKFEEPQFDDLYSGDDAETQMFRSTDVPIDQAAELPAGREAPNRNTMIRRSGSGAAMAWIIPTSGLHAGRMLRVEPGGTVLGRDPGTSQIVLSDGNISGMHAKIRGERIDGRYQFHILDMGSANGTFVDNVRIDRCRLLDGARIRMGVTEVVFKQSTL